jgi:hypothetical protein
MAVVVAVSAMILPGIADGAGTPSQVCAGAKLKAAGKNAGLKLACHGKSARKGVAVDATCLAKADGKLLQAFTKAEQKGGCLTTGDANDVSDAIDSSVGASVALLRPIQSGNRCVGVKLKATGKKAKTKLGCHAKATRKGLSVDTQCLAKTEARFAATFASAEAHGPCLTNNDADGIESQVDNLVNQLVAALPSNTTTTTVPGPVCGNGVVEGSEQCDTDPQAICIAGGRSGCFASGNPDECECCTMPGETGQVDVGGTNECCDGSPPQPAGPGAYFCAGTCSAGPFPTCGGSCQSGTTCVPMRFGGVDSVRLRSARSLRRSSAVVHRRRVPGGPGMQRRCVRVLPIVTL